MIDNTNKRIKRTLAKIMENQQLEQLHADMDELVKQGEEEKKEEGGDGGGDKAKD